MLVMSRLTFNVHTWVAKPQVLRVLNGPYMRMLRRIAGEMRFDNTAISDFEVRTRLQQPSIDCILIRKRLRYVARIVEAKPQSLVAFLRVARADRALPWVEQMYADFAALHRSGYEVAASLPPLGAPELWPAWIAQHSNEWIRLVDGMTFPQSVLDKVVAEGTPSHALPCPLCVGPCVRAFETPKALAQHLRIAHAVRSPMRVFATADGICPACGVKLCTRLRLLAHLSDSRRPRCREWILQHGTPIAPEEVHALDEHDRLERRAAQRAGHTHAIATQPAMRANGQRTGRICSNGG